MSIGVDESRRAIRKGGADKPWEKTLRVLALAALISPVVCLVVSLSILYITLPVYGLAKGLLAGFVPPFIVISVMLVISSIVGVAMRVRRGNSANHAIRAMFYSVVNYGTLVGLIIVCTAYIAI